MVEPGRGFDLHNQSLDLIFMALLLIMIIIRKNNNTIGLTTKTTNI